jgi:hypothetical protein
MQQGLFPNDSCQTSSFRERPCRMQQVATAHCTEPTRVPIQYGLLWHRVSAGRHYPRMLGGLEGAGLDMDIENAWRRRCIALKRLIAGVNC